MDHLPSNRPATKADLQALEKTMDERFEAVDQRFKAVDRRFDAVDHRFSIFEVKLEALEKRLENRIDALGDNFEQRLLAAISGVRETSRRQLNIQTRVFVFSTISALITLAALTLALSGA